MADPGPLAVVRVNRAGQAFTSSPICRLPDRRRLRGVRGGRANSGEGGFIVPADGFLRRVADFCRDRGILLGMHLHGYGCAGTSAAGLWTGLPGTGSRRFGYPVVGQRAGVIGDVRDPPLRRRGHQTAVAAATWRPAKRLAVSGSPNPTSAPTPPGMRTRAPNATATTGCSTDTKMWITNGSVADVAVVWAGTDDGRPRFRRAHRHPRLHRARDHLQDVPAGVGDQRARARRRPAAPAAARTAGRHQDHPAHR